MVFFKHLLLGIKSYWKALRFIWQYKLYWYLPIPAGLMLLIYYVGWEILNWNGKWSVEAGCLSCANMNDTIWFLLEMLLSITIGFILMKFAKYIVVVVLSPLFTIISEHVEKKLTANSYPFRLKQTLHDIKRAGHIALRNIMWEYIFFTILLIVSALGWKEVDQSPVFYLTFAIGFYYYGFSFLDYINERRRLDIDQSIHFIRKHKGLAVSIGCIYSIMILVPVNIAIMFDFTGFLAHPFASMWTFFYQFILWMLASLAPILTIVAATIAMHEIVDLRQNEFANHPEVTEKKLTEEEESKKSPKE